VGRWSESEQAPVTAIVAVSMAAMATRRMWNS